jgi:hypothetical protein
VCSVEREKKESRARAIENICATCPGEFQFNNRASVRPYAPAFMNARDLRPINPRRNKENKDVILFVLTDLMLFAHSSAMTFSLIFAILRQCKSGGNGPSDFGPD